MWLLALIEVSPLFLFLPLPVNLRRQAEVLLDVTHKGYVTVGNIFPKTVRKQRGIYRAVITKRQLVDARRNIYRNNCSWCFMMVISTTRSLHTIFSYDVVLDKGDPAIAAKTKRE